MLGLSEIENTLIEGDVVEVLKTIPDCVFDLAFTSPPYNLKNSTGNGMKDGRGGKWSNAKLINGYQKHGDNMPHDEYVKWQRAIITEVMRTLKEDGAFFYNHKWRVQDGLIQNREDILEGFPVRQIIIWKRKGGINFNPGYFLPTFEVIYLIAKPGFRLEKGANSHGDIWDIGQDLKNPHPASFPLELAERVITSAPGAFVLDPFMGSGTTAIAAMKHGKKFCGIDQSPEYLDYAKKRISHFEKLGRDKGWDTFDPKIKLLTDY
jgi:modification methylase